MSERKVLNKYFPPEFDPSKIPRRKLGKDRQQVVRLMAPFSMRCGTCGEYIYKGKKFNARKETVQNETYYGIKIFRFYIKCTQCSAEITFKTDPKNTDYVAEHGAARNFEPWRDIDEKTDSDRLAELEAEEAALLDPMAKLEGKAVDSKREMDILDALQDLKSRNARIDRAEKKAAAGGGGGGDKVLETVLSSTEVGDAELLGKLDAHDAQRRKEEEEDEEEVRRVFGRVKALGDAAVPGIEVLEPLSEEEEEEEEGKKDAEGFKIPSSSSSAAPKASTSSSSSTSTSTTTTTTTSIKRKLDAVEPSAIELLSAGAREFVANKAPAAAAAAGQKKKKKGNNELANKLGIKLKSSK